MAMREIDPRGLPGRGAYRLLTQLVVPRPIAWVSTLGADGTRNLAPHSYFNMVSSEPPVLHFTSTGEKDTLRNVRASGEFVVNVVTAELVEAMNLTAADFPPGEDEFRWAGLEAAPAVVVGVPRVAAARATIECRVHSELRVGNGTMVFGEVVHVSAAEDIFDGDVVLPDRLRAVGRLGGSGYATTADAFALDRPRWVDVRGHGPDGND